MAGLKRVFTRRKAVVATIFDRGGPAVSGESGEGRGATGDVDSGATRLRRRRRLEFGHSQFAIRNSQFGHRIARRAVSRRRPSAFSWRLFATRPLRLGRCFRSARSRVAPRPTAQTPPNSCRRWSACDDQQLPAEWPRFFCDEKGQDTNVGPTDQLTN